jgi:SNF2 family DNA or RNA helicase
MNCPECKQEVEIKSTSTFGAGKYFTLTCNHFVAEDKLFPAQDLIFEQLFEFQKKGVQFWRDCNYKGLLADETRLGKSIQTLGIIRQDWDNITPALIVVKSRTKLTWNAETLYWQGNPKPENEKWGRHYKYDINPTRIPQILEARTRPLPGFGLYICSMDSLEKVTKNLLKYDVEIKTLVIDECHNFKNMQTGRTKALHKFVKEEGIEQVMCLSATPILNNALEFYSTLHLIAPHIFRNRDEFYREWISPGSKPGTGGIKRWRHDSFFEITKDFILRRTKKEVMEQQPQFSRIPEIMEVEDPDFVKVYKQGQKELQDFIDEAGRKGVANTDRVSLIAILTHLRQLCGIAKVPAVIEAVNEFFESEEDVPKLLIGVHHQAVGQSLAMALNEEYGAVYLSGTTGSFEAEKAIEDFKNNPDKKVLVVSTLAYGEGVDFQFLHTTFLVERQWNTYKEKQFEDRMNGLYQKWPMTAVYFMVKNSIDQWFHELILRKMQWTESALDPDFYEKHPEHQSEANVDLWQLAEMCLQDLK